MVNNFYEISREGPEKILRGLVLLKYQCNKYSSALSKGSFELGIIIKALPRPEFGIFLENYEFYLIVIC